MLSGGSGCGSALGTQMFRFWAGSWAVAKGLDQSGVMLLARELGCPMSVVPGSDLARRRSTAVRSTRMPTAMTISPMVIALAVMWWVNSYTCRWREWLMAWENSSL